MTVVIAASPAVFKGGRCVRPGCVEADPVVSRGSASDAPCTVATTRPSARLRAAIQDVQDGFSTKYAEGLATLMTLNFQQFEGVSLVAA